jgi:hypothetical protein
MAVSERGDTVRRRFARTLVTLFDRIQSWLVIGAFCLLTLVLIDPVRRAVARYVPLDTDFYVWLVAGMFTVTFAVLRQLESETSQLAGRLDANSSQLIENVNIVLDKLKESVCRPRVPEHERSLTVLGLTMYFTWPILERWIEHGDLRGWKLRLFILSPDYLRGNSSFKPGWAGLSENFANQISQQVESLRGQGVTLDLRRYPVLPGLHGYQLGNGELFISFGRWDPADGKAANPNYFYEHFSAGDVSERAQQYRMLFDNWVQHLEAIGVTLQTAPDTGI